MLKHAYLFKDIIHNRYCEVICDKIEHFFRMELFKLPELYDDETTNSIGRVYLYEGEPLYYLSCIISKLDEGHWNCDRMTFLKLTDKIGYRFKEALHDYFNLLINKGVSDLKFYCHSQNKKSLKIYNNIDIKDYKILLDH